MKNLLTAVFDEDTKIYLTLTYYLSSSIKRTDEHYDDYIYVMLTPMGNYVVGCKEGNGFRGEGIYGMVFGDDCFDKYILRGAYSLKDYCSFIDTELIQNRENKYFTITSGVVPSLRKIKTGV